MGLPENRAEIIRLRARIVVLEKMSMASLGLVLRIRPEELKRSLELARPRLSVEYTSVGFAEDVTDPEERQLLAIEVERLMRGLQSELGFAGGTSTFEHG